MAGTSRSAALTFSWPTAQTAREALEQNPGQQSVVLPDALAVGADYDLTVMSRADLPAQKFADYSMSPEGQKILISHGFAPSQK
jgi:hypothetical protein